MDKEAIARVLASVPLEAPTRFGKGYGAPCLTVDQVERLTDALMSAQAERAKRLTGLGGRTSLIQDLERLKLWCRSKDPTAPIWLHIDEAIDTLRALDHVPPAAKATAILALQSSERGEADTVAFVQKWMMSGDHERHPLSRRTIAREQGGDHRAMREGGGGIPVTRIRGHRGRTGHRLRNPRSFGPRP
jgi:hypothetical protein